MDDRNFNQNRILTAKDLAARLQIGRDKAYALIIISSNTDW